MRVAEVMSRGVDPVAPDATVQDAATQMAEFDVGAVFIGDDVKLVGVLTDRDILLRVVVEGRHPSEVAAGDVMSKAVFACKEDDPIERVLAEMRERQIRRMPVLDSDGKTVGVVVLSDLAKGFAGPEQIQETLRRISEPHRSREAPQPEEPEPKEGAEAKEQEPEQPAKDAGEPESTDTGKRARRG